MPGVAVPCDVLLAPDTSEEPELFPWLGPLGAIPLPSKWIIEFGEPISTEAHDEDAWQDAALVFNETDRIRESIQQMLYRNLMSRRSPFF